MKTLLLNFLEFFLVLGVMFMACAFVARLALARLPVARWLDDLETRGRGASYVISALFGAVTPFCVCTTIPVFTTMIQMGARGGVAVAFLFSSPLVSLSSAALIVFLFGWKFAGVYIACAVTFAILGGALVSALGLDNEVCEDIRPETDSACEDRSAAGAARASFQLFRDLLVPLFIGALIAGLIHNYIPVEWIMAVNHFPAWILVPVMALIGFPIYSNIMVLAPVAFSLVHKGMLPGAVMAFLMAGAGMSFPTAIVLKGLLKPRLYWFYLGYTFAVYCFSGFIFGWLS